MRETKEKLEEAVGHRRMRLGKGAEPRSSVPGATRGDPVFRGLRELKKKKRHPDPTAMSF